MQAKTERFEMRLEQEVLDRVDAWRATESDHPSRAEAIRRIIDIGLAETGAPQPRLSDGERLIALMVGEIYKHLKLKGEIDPDFVAAAIDGGHFWALDWQYRGVFHKDIDRRATVTEVVDILDMWEFIEEGYAALSTKDKERISKEAGCTKVEFVGFDGNNEVEHLSIARFMIDRLGRFTHFKGRDLNSHCRILDGYRVMVEMFEPMRKTLVGRALSAPEIIELLNSRRLARRH